MFPLFLDIWRLSVQWSLSVGKIILSPISLWPLNIHSISNASTYPSQAPLHLSNDKIIQLRYFFISYFLATASRSPSASEFIYDFQPEHQLACQRQIRPRIDLGLLSYFALKAQVAQFGDVIWSLPIFWIHGVELWIIDFELCPFFESIRFHRFYDCIHRCPLKNRQFYQTIHFR